LSGSINSDRKFHFLGCEWINLNGQIRSQEVSLHYVCSKGVSFFAIVQSSLDCSVFSPKLARNSPMAKFPHSPESPQIPSQAKSSITPTTSVKVNKAEFSSGADIPRYECDQTPSNHFISELFLRTISETRIL
jgi:hypothetical protein